MRKKSKPSLIFISGNSNRVLAEELARTFGCKLGKSEVTKFADGAWIVILLIPVVVYTLTRIHKHYLDVGKELSLFDTPAPEHLPALKHTVIVPISGMHRGVIEALQYALAISDDVRAVYVEINSKDSERMRSEWDRWGHDIPLVILKSPYRSIIRPLLRYLDDLGGVTHGDVITVVIPEFITKKWWHNVLHNQTAMLIRAALLFWPRRIVTTSVRYRLKST